MAINVADVSKRVHDILAYVDKRVGEMCGTTELPVEGQQILTVRFDAEDEIDIKAVEILGSRGIARWIDTSGVGKPFEVETGTALRVDDKAVQTKATLALAARIDALEGAIDQLVTQNERLLEAMATKPPKALPAAKAKPAKKAGRRG